MMGELEVVISTFDGSAVETWPYEKLPIEVLCDLAASGDEEAIAILDARRNGGG